MTSHPPQDEEQPLTEHLIELRNRLAVVIAVILTITVLTYPFSQQLAFWIWKNLMPPGTPITAYSPLEWILTRLTLSLLTALFLGIPVLVYEILMFTSKGLYPNEKKFFIKITPLSLLLFTLGSATAYYIALPLLFNITIAQTQNIAQTQLSIKHTFDIIAMLTAGFGIAFQFSLLLILAIKTGLATPEELKNKRIIIYGLLLALAMLISPDPTGIAQLMIAIMLAALFEFSLLISRIF